MPVTRVLYRNDEVAPEFLTRELCADDRDVTMRLARAELEFAYVSAALSPAAKLELFKMIGDYRSRVRGVPEGVTPLFFGPLTLSHDDQVERRSNPTFARARRRSDCGQVQLKLSSSADLRRRILSAIRLSGLSTGDFAVSVLGVDTRTVQRYLAGEKVPDSRRTWLDRLESVEADEGGVRITLRAGARNAQRAHNNAPRVLEGVAAGDDNST